MTIFGCRHWIERLRGLVDSLRKCVCRRRLRQLAERKDGGRRLESSEDDREESHGRNRGKTAAGKGESFWLEMNIR